MTALIFSQLPKSTLPNTGIIVQLHTNKTHKGGESLKILMYICQAPGTLIPPNEKSTKQNTNRGNSRGILSSFSEVTFI